MVHTLLALQKAYRFSEIIVPVNPAMENIAKDHLHCFGLKKVCVVSGGKTRAQSVQNALKQISSDACWVLVHDAARPLVSPDLVRRTIQGASKTGGAIAALPILATVKRAQLLKRVIQKTENRDTLWLAQTPQVFRRDLLEKRYRRLGRSAFGCTDEAALFDGTAIAIKIVPGEVKNIKITTPDDGELFQYYLKNYK